MFSENKYVKLVMSISMIWGVLAVALFFTLLSIHFVEHKEIPIDVDADVDAYLDSSYGGFDVNVQGDIGTY